MLEKLLYTLTFGMLYDMVTTSEDEHLDFSAHSRGPKESPAPSSDIVHRRCGVFPPNCGPGKGYTCADEEPELSVGGIGSNWLR